jgi:ribose transport system substrate-binding protein
VNRRKLLRTKVSPIVLVALVVSLVAATGALASKPGPLASKRATGGSNVALATQLAQSIMKPVKWTAPGPAISVGKKLSGDKVELVAAVDNQFSETAGKAMQAAGTAAGVTVTTDYTNGTLPAIESGIQAAITSRAKALVILSVPTGEIEQPLKNAIAHGIRVIQMGEHDPGPLNTVEKAVGVVADITGCYSCAGRDIADFVVSESKGDAHALFINSPDIGDANAESEAFTAQMHKLCPKNCSVQTVGIDVANWATQISSNVSSAIAAHPDINFVVPVFDTMEVFVTPAIKAANASNRVKLASFNASEAQMKEMQTGAKPTWIADGGYDLKWWGWAAMDDVYRVLLHKAALPSEAVPLRFFTQASIKSYNVAGSQDPWYGDPKYVSGFEKLWSITH